jgi:hypothetical protein
VFEVSNCSKSRDLMSLKFPEIMWRLSFKLKLSKSRRFLWFSSKFLISDNFIESRLGFIGRVMNSLFQFVLILSGSSELLDSSFCYDEKEV